MNTHKEWEKEFEEKFAGATGYVNPYFSVLIKFYITTLLDKQRAEIVGEIEKLFNTYYVDQSIPSSPPGKLVINKSQFVTLLQAFLTTQHENK